MAVEQVVFHSLGNVRDHRRGPASPGGNSSAGMGGGKGGDAVIGFWGAAHPSRSSRSGYRYRRLTFMEFYFSQAVSPAFINEGGMFGGGFEKDSF